MKNEIQNSLKDNHEETLKLSSEEFWKELYPNLKIPDEIWKELTDFYFIMNEVPKVYYHVTGGRLSKPNYFSSAVISESDNYQNEILEDLLKEHLQNILSKTGISYSEALGVDDLSDIIIQLLDKVTI
jgi:hypothetical protein